MASQHDLDLPQRVLERLTGEPRPTSQPIPNPKRSPGPTLYALIIGISKYLEQNSLQGAASDAQNFKKYLTVDLLVPEAQVTTLVDSQATRSTIITEFQNLAMDSRISKNDPIVIYYAGHGSLVKAPTNRAANGPLIQSLVPYDASRPDSPTAGVLPIPDFTIGSLLNRLSVAKGDNITVIFDCCHSASGSRRYVRGERSIPRFELCPLPSNVDSDILVEGALLRARGLVSEDEIGIQAMRSHVLLAACGENELAHETLEEPYNGYFTTELLVLLRKIGPEKLTYKGCMLRFPKINAPGPQSPVCEGAHVNRIFFNAMVSSGNNSFILLENKGNNTYLLAGTAQGFTPGCVFTIHSESILGPNNPSLGTMKITQVTPFRSLLTPLDDEPTTTVPQPGYGRQIAGGNEQALDVFITPKFEQSVSPDPKWKDVFSGGQRDVIIRLSDESVARLILDINANGETRFTLPRLKAATDHGIETIKYTTPANFSNVQPVLSAAAKWFWQLERYPQPRPFKAAIKIQFFKLKRSGEYDEASNPILQTDGGDLNFNGTAEIEASNEHYYGLRISSTAARDLYAYLFYFSVSTLAITPKFLKVFGSNQVDPSLPRGGTLALGYGSGGVAPLQFRLEPGEVVDVGILKLFLATSPIDMDSISQPSPFFQTRRPVDDHDIDEQLGALPLWDAISTIVVQRPGHASGSQTPTSQSSPENPPGMTPLFENLPPGQQDIILQNVNFARGIFICPDGSIRESRKQAAIPFRPLAGMIFSNRIAISEEVLSSNERDARLVHAGLQPLRSISGLPWLHDQRLVDLEPGEWITRRTMLTRLTLNVSVKELRPDATLVKSVQAALNQKADWQKFKALQDVYEAWGDLVPLNLEIGASLSATGTGSCNHQRRSSAMNPLVYAIQQNLGPRQFFERLTLADIQGGKPSLLGQNYEAWLRSTAVIQNWRRIKVTRVTPILDLLAAELRYQVYQLYSALIFRSTCVGTHRIFGFDSTSHPRTIEQIEIGFSDSRIERITIRYVCGRIAGPYGTPINPLQFERFVMSKGEYITDIFTWTANQQISSIQLVANTGRVSPVYGAVRGISQPPELQSGNGCALVGLSGGFDSAGITQLQGIWRGDIHTKGYRCTQTSHVGGSDGTIWNDLRLLGERASIRISSIDARSPGTGNLAALQITYTWFVEGASYRKTSPIYGTDSGQTTSWNLQDGEYITGVRGRHDGTSICEMQFLSNRSNSSPAFGQPAGNHSFSIASPKTKEGRDMALYYTVGKSIGRVNSILFVWADPELVAL